AWTEHTVEIATDVVRDQGDSRAVPGTGFEFDDSNLFDSGFITGPTGWRDDQNPPNGDPLDPAYDPRTPSFGLQSNNQRRDVKQRFVTDGYGLSFGWDVSDNWAVSVDYQHVKSTVDNLDNTIWGSTYQNALIDLDGDEIPHVEFTEPILCSDAPSATCATYMAPGHESFEDPYNS